MNINCIGAGPGGLFFSILVKLFNPDACVRVFERSVESKVSGFGIILDSEAQALIKTADQLLGDRVASALYSGDKVAIDHLGKQFISEGHSICAINRGVFLRLLRERAESLGVEIVYEHAVENSKELTADVIVACDGASSLVRSEFSCDFNSKINYGRNRFVWCQLSGESPGITFSFRKAFGGWVWSQLYQHAPNQSTVILECDDAAFHGLKLKFNSEADQVHAVFDVLYKNREFSSDGLQWVEGRLNEGVWRCFPNVECKKWYTNNVVLLGDAAHTQHYSVGMGTKMALSDALSLSRQLFSGSRTLEGRLKAYNTERMAALQEVLRQSWNSQQWFEERKDWEQMNSDEFAYALLARIQQPNFSIAKLRRMQILAEKIRGSKSSSLSLHRLSEGSGVL